MNHRIMTYNTALLVSSILATFGNGWGDMLNKDSANYNLQLWTTIYLLSEGNMKQAQHKMATKIGRKACAAYKEEKERQYWASL